MNCRRAVAVAGAHARGQLLEASPREEALAHVARCESCAAKLAEQRAVAAAVRAVVEEVEGLGASPRVESALREAFRERMNEVGPASQRVSLPRLPRWSVAAVAASLLLLAISVGLVRRMTTTRSDEPRAAEEAPAPRERETPIVVALPGVGDERRPATTRRTKRMRRGVSRSRARAQEEEAATDFFLLEDEGQHVPLESGQVVRVELPLSELLPTEMAASAEASEKVVKADLLIGQDGLARAIRFVK